MWQGTLIMLAVRTLLLCCCRCGDTGPARACGACRRQGGVWLGIPWLGFG